MSQEQLPKFADFPGVVEPIAPPDIEVALRRLAAWPHCVLLDSARRGEPLGRYSFLAADPFEFFVVPAERAEYGADLMAPLRQALSRLSAPGIPGLPPFQGGLAGAFSYELGRTLERIPAARFDEFQTPLIAVGLYDVVLAVDHLTGQAWIISQGFPQFDPQARRERARDRARWMRQLLDGLLTPNVNQANESLPSLSVADLAPQYDLSEWTASGGFVLTSDFSPSQYMAAVQCAIDYIYAGDIFQVNLSQRLLCPALSDSLSLYMRLRRRNPATFAGYFDMGPAQLLSASPERFVQVRGGRVEARPIKGTRRRTARPEADLFAGDELRESEKDNAENVMIVDLLRNDLSRVCEADSVVVSELCRLEQYEFVQHLVSVVQGQLAPGKDALDLLAAAFPGGSITGAPKPRAMEIIAELEPTARGFYCGAFGYLGFDGSMDLNIPIRTITASRGWWQLPVGGGIVAQSSPAREYEETWHKAEGMLKALR